MGLLDNRIGSPRQLADELGASLPSVSYHVRQLTTMGFLKLVRRRQKRGSIEHFYTAAVRPTIYDDAWSRTPDIVKKAIVGGKIQQTGREVVAAAKAGGFERHDAHFTRTRKTLTAEGWRLVSAELLRMLDRLDQLADEDAERLRENPDAETIDATVVMMLFESAAPSGFGDGDDEADLDLDDVADVAPPN